MWVWVDGAWRVTISVSADWQVTVSWNGDSASSGRWFIVDCESCTVIVFATFVGTDIFRSYEWNAQIYLDFSLKQSLYFKAHPSRIWCMIARTWPFCLGIRWIRSWRDDSWTFWLLLFIFSQQENFMSFAAKWERRDLWSFVSTFRLQTSSCRSEKKLSWFFTGFFCCFATKFFCSFLGFERSINKLFISVDAWSYKWNMIWTISKTQATKKKFNQTHRVRISWVEDDFVILKFSRALQSHNFQQVSFR